MIREALEVVGVGCLVAAAWLVSIELGLVATGIAALNWSLGGFRR